MTYHSEFNPAAVLKRWATLGEFDGVVPVFGLIDEIAGHVVGISSVVFRFDDDLAIDHGQELPRGIDRVSFDDVIIVFLCPNAVFHDPHFLVFVAKGLPNVIVEHKKYKSFHALMLANIGFAVLAIFFSDLSSQLLEELQSSRIVHAGPVRILGHRARHENSLFTGLESYA